MEETDIKRFSVVMATLCEIYNVDTVSSLKAETYFRTLKDISIDELENGMDEMLKTRTYSRFPTPAEIREYALAGRNRIALMAHLKLGQAISRAGIYKNVIFDDPVIHAVVMTYTNGWIDICEKEYGRKDFQSEFVSRYLALTHHFQKDPLLLADVPLYLEGIIESTNRKNGTYERMLKLLPDNYIPGVFGDKAEIERWHEEAKKIKAAIQTGSSRQRSGGRENGGTRKFGDLIYET